MVEPRPAHVMVVAPGHAPALLIERAITRAAEELRFPDEIHVVAPRERVAEVQRDLLSAERGAERFAEICRSAGIPRHEVVFNQRTLHAADLVNTPASVAAEQIFQLVRSLTSSDDVVLWAIVANDAGPVGHLLHGALHVAGRPCDRLLLDAAEDGHPRRARRAPPGARHQIELPIVLWPVTEAPPRTYDEAVQRRRLERRRLTHPEVLRLDVRRRQASVGDTLVPLPAMQFFWLYYLALAPGERFPLAELISVPSTARRSPAHLTQKLSDGRVRVFPSDLQRAFGQVFPHGVDKFEGMYQRCCGPNPGLPSTISKINANLRRALGGGAGPYLIQGGRGAGGYRLTLPAAAIQIVGSPGRGQ